LYQSFEEVILTGGAVGGADRQRTTAGVGILQVEAGLNWSPPNWRSVRFSAGYHFEQWWELGRNDNIGSAGSLTEHGVFLRVQFGF
jgi:hypothetical protein